MRGLYAGLAVLLLVSACASPSQTPSEPSQQPEPQAQPATPEAEKEDTRPEGMTLQDVADELEWRKKTTEEMKTGS